VDGRVHRIYPSSRAARLHQDLPDGSREQDGQPQLDVRDNQFVSWTDGNVAPTSPGPGGNNSQALITGSGTRGMNSAGRKYLEAIMASVVVAIIAVFLGGIAIGVVGLVALGVRGEDRRKSLTGGEVPGRLARSVRRLNGVGLRDLDPERFVRVGELIH
jgi:hypothetical protein